MNDVALPWLAAPLKQLAARQGHALLLTGGAGSGLYELALQLAQTWLCEATPAPCGHCVACRLLQAGTHPDLRVLLPEALSAALGTGDDVEAADGESKSKRKPSREIKVDAVRAAIDWAQTSPARGRGKVLVVHPADALNVVAANALLKTLEEPPGSVRWLLCSSAPGSLLPTLRSRCQQIKVPTPATEEALAWLKSEGLADAGMLLAAAGGEPLLARELAAEGWTAAAWSALPGQVAAGEAGALAGLAVPRVTQVLQQICHDAMAVQAGAAPRYFPAGSVPSPGGDDARRWQRLATWSRALLAAAVDAEHPWNAPLRIESLVLQGRQALSPDAG